MKISVIIPARNEEEGIGSVINQVPAAGLRRLGHDCEVVVVDNDSSDLTAKIARGMGATVIRENKRGKGIAIRTGFAYVLKDADYIVMLDADNTYRPQEMPALLSPLFKEGFDAVVGSRFAGRMGNGAMTALNRFGNRLFSFLVRVFYRLQVTDVLTGYLAFRRETIEKLSAHLKSDGFAIEMEMFTKMARLGCKVRSVPISYQPRAGHSNLKPLRDGMRILAMFIANLFWHPHRTRLGALRAKHPRRVSSEDPAHRFHPL